MKKYHGIRYSYRPKSYWSPSDPLVAILQNVTGENRRQMIIDHWQAGTLDELDLSLLQDESGIELRTRLGRIHPSFLGGEYLPGYLPGEVEIARICLESTTSDVISLRACPVAKGIAYRMIDEYEGDFSLPIPFSEKPLSLEELVRQFEEGRLDDLDTPGGVALCFNVMNAEDRADPGDLRHFTQISSTIYRQLEAHFENVFDDWLKNAYEQRATKVRHDGDESQ